MSENIYQTIKIFEYISCNCSFAYLLHPRCECRACEERGRGAFAIVDAKGKVTKVEPRVVGEVQGRKRRRGAKA